MIDIGDGKDGGFVEENDWDHLFDDIPIPNSSAFQSIEQFLMTDDDLQPPPLLDLHYDLTDSFFSDVFLDSPADSDKVVNDIPQPQKEQDHDHDHNDNKLNADVVVDQDESDPLAKKRKRQLRNRDAAVRSRERKKMYVRDLELKSKYFEAECRRLGMLLQCYLAENHALRLSLHNSKAVDASRTKQESAVLLLESLLLGSLLWFLGIIYLLILPKQLPSTQKSVPLDNGNQGSVGRREGRSKIFRNLVVQSFMTGKRCKASRSRMKLIPFALEVKV